MGSTELVVTSSTLAGNQQDALQRNFTDSQVYRCCTDVMFSDWHTHAAARPCTLQQACHALLHLTAAEATNQYVLNFTTKLTLGHKILQLHRLLVCVSGDTRGLSSDNQSHNGHVTLPPDCTQHAWTYSSVINVHQCGLDLDLLSKNTLLRSPGDDLMQAAGCFSGRDVMDDLPRCKRGNTTQIWQQALPATFTLFLYKVKPTSECAEERVTHLMRHTLHPEFGSQLQPALWYWVATDKPARLFNM